MHLIKNVAAQRRHSCAASDKDHLFFGLTGKELAKRAGDCHLVASFEIENIGRHFPCGDATRLGGCNSHILHHNALLNGITGPRIGLLKRFWQVCRKISNFNLVPIKVVFFVNIKLFVRPKSGIRQIHLHL